MLYQYVDLHPKRMKGEEHHGFLFSGIEKGDAGSITPSLLNGETKKHIHKVGLNHNC